MLIMNNIRKLVLLFALFSIVSCMDEDISNLSNTIEIQPNIAIPIIHSTTTLLDLLPDDENLTFDDDGFIRIIYKEDSIAQVFSDTLLVIEDQDPTKSFSLEAIDIDDFQTDINVTLSELTDNLESDLAEEINLAVEICSIGLAYFPPIYLSLVAYYHQASDEFEFDYVLISQGILSVEIINNFALRYHFIRINKY